MSLMIDRSIEKAEQIKKSIDEMFISGKWKTEMTTGGKGLRLNKADIHLNFSVPYHQRPLIWSYLVREYGYRSEGHTVIIPFPEHIKNQIQIAKIDREEEARKELEKRKKEMEQNQIQKARLIEERLLKKAKEGLA